MMEPKTVEVDGGFVDTNVNFVVVIGGRMDDRPGEVAYVVDEGTGEYARISDADVVRALITVVLAVTD